MREDIPQDPPLTPEQNKLLANLTDEDLKIIDAALMHNITDQWRKMARVIGTTMRDLESNYYGLPDLFYGERIRCLKERSLLESQGDLRKMRYSEVRLTQK